MTQLNVVENLFLAPVLGHGRMAETYLAAVALLYGLILLIPGEVASSKATSGSVTELVGAYLAIPFLLKAYFSGYGVIGVIRAWPFTHTHRFIGGLLGITLWSWYSVKFILIGALGATGFPFVTVAVFVCFRVMVLAALRIPPIATPARWP